MRAWRAEGKTFERVRMMTDPPTEYLRWMLSFTRFNIEAGEDIRWLSEADAKMFGAPTHDLYLLDDTRVVITLFGDDGVTGAEVLDDAMAVEGARRWRKLAMLHSTPHAEYINRSPGSP